jgi:hypothetical protein
MALRLLAVAGLVLMPSVASADHGHLSLPIDTVISADEGEIVTLVSEPVDPALQGATCSWDFHVQNQESVNPGNDLVLFTSGFEWVVSGVEDAAGQVLHVEGSFELGETVTVSLRMGPHGVFSAGLTIEVVCQEGTAGATATPAPTETPAPTTVPTATAAPEVAGKVVTAQPTATAPAALANTGPPSSTGPLVMVAGLLTLAGLGAPALASRARR